MCKSRVILSLAVIFCLLIGPMISAGCGNGEGGASQASKDAPTITSTNPGDGAADVATDVAIEATFSKSMESSTVTTSTFIVKGPDGDIAGSVSCRSRTAIFAPSSKLKGSNTYTATITTGVQDTDGKAMDSDYSWSFSVSDKTEPVLSEISATDTTSTSVKIAWRTDEPATTQISYGVTTDCESSSGLDSDLRTDHQVALTGLSAATTYYYKTKSQDKAGNLASSAAKIFTTNPPQLADFAVSDLVIDHKEAQVFEELKASAKVKNKGDLEGTCTVNLKVNGVQVQTQDIKVGAGKIETVTFTFAVDRITPNCAVEINGLKGTINIGGWQGVPQHRIGDTWTSRTFYSGAERTIVCTVTGEDVTDGRNCYVLDISVNNPPADIQLSRMIVKVDKVSKLPIRVEGSGAYMGVPGQITANLTYRFSGLTMPYPLEVGKEFIMTATVDITVSTPAGATMYHNNYSFSYKFLVEKRESIQVPAGTFNCLKVVMWDQNGAPLGTVWVADEVRGWFARAVEVVNGNSLDLVSYSCL